LAGWFWEGELKIEGPGKALRIYVGESDHWHGKPLYAAIVEKAREAGLAGATVTRGVMGFGANSRIHSASILRLSEDLPVVIDIVDAPERIEKFLPMLDEMVDEGMVITWDVVVEKYVHSEKE
jgi:PII-like signaling protein